MIADERTIKRNDRIAGYLGPVASSFTLAWLASHRNRLRSFILGGHKISVVVAYDSKATKRLRHEAVEVAALETIVYGPEVSRKFFHDIIADADRALGSDGQVAREALSNIRNALARYVEYTTPPTEVSE